MELSVLISTRGSCVVNVSPLTNRTYFPPCSAQPDGMTSSLYLPNKQSEWNTCGPLLAPFSFFFVRNSMFRSTEPSWVNPSESVRY